MCFITFRPSNIYVRKIIYGYFPCLAFSWCVDIGQHHIHIFMKVIYRFIFVYVCARV